MKHNFPIDFQTEEEEQELNEIMEILGTDRMNKNGLFDSVQSDDRIFDNKKKFAGLTDVNVMKEHLEKLKKQSEQFNIYVRNQVRTFIYKNDDPIFKLAEANPNVLETSVYAVECSCCLEEFKGKDKKSKLQCMFCAQVFCAKCRYKSREFPRSRQNPKEKGDCCKICDYKFII